MERFKYIYLALFAFTIVSCVDDYFEANPPQRLDAPYAYVTSSIPEAKDGIALTGGEEVTFSINIVDAPGVLNAIDFVFSKGGEVVSHTFDQLIGQTSGTFDVTVRAPTNLQGGSTFTMEISDAQEEPKVLTISKVLDVSYLYEGPDFTVEIDDADGMAVEGDIVPVVITVNDVPSGAIASIAVAGSAGEVVFDQAQLDALIGASSGTVTGTMEIGPVTSTGTYNVSVSITDALQNRQVIQSDEILLVCPSAVDIAGTYVATSNGVNGETGADYVGLEKEVIVTQVNAGQFEVSDVSFGVYDILQSYDPLPGVVNICGTDLTGDESVADGWTATGTIATETPGVIYIEWSNQYGDSGRTTLRKQ